MASSSNHSFDVFINHHGPDVKKTLASHLNRSLLSHGLRVFLEQPQMRAGDNFHSEITDAIRTATVHVAIFSPGYAESEWCLNKLLYLLESGAPIIPVYYHVQPAELRWTQIMEDGVFSKGLRKLEPLQDTITIQKWREALSLVAAQKRGLDLQESCNGDEGELVEKIVQRVMEEIKSILSVGTLEFRRSQLYGGTGGKFWNDGTYSGIRRITMAANHDNWLTSVQLHYGLEGDERLKDKYFPGLRHGVAGGAQKEYNLNYPEEFVTKISGYIGRYVPWDVIISLTFHTNQGKQYGPCGLEEEGRYFETQEAGGKIVGIFGFSGDLIDSIGVYILKPRNSRDELSESD